MQSIKVFGNPASPYTQKLIAYLRYKNIKYNVTWGDVKTNLELLNKIAPSPILLPTVLLNDDSDPITDTTPIIRILEEKFKNKYHKFIIFFILLLLCVSVTITNSRGAWVGMIIAMILMFINKKKIFLIHFFLL